MSKMYHDNGLGYSCILSTNREDRPFINEKTEACPFCPGHETLLEKIWLEFKEEDQCFDVRIVNNKYAVCYKDTELYGIHDVVIDTPKHEENPKDFSIKQWQKILQAIWQRWHEIEKDERINFIQIFKNYGRIAGASILHSHWQIVALEEIPLTVINQYKSFENKHKEEGKCPICEKVKCLSNEYKILENAQWIAFAPEASQLPHETWIVPKRHLHHYGETTQESREALGEVLRTLLKGIDDILEQVAYNICFIGGKIQGDYHFFIKILPRVGNWAGFELATSCFINTVDPLRYVQRLKEALANVRSDEND